MPVTLARRMAHLRASEIREILKVTVRPEVISFAGGLPAPECFPVEELADVSTRVLRESGPAALQYSTTEGHRPLRERIAARAADKLGARLDPDTILVTTGSQQGLDLVGKVLLDEGDVVLCESPTYLGAINALRVFSPRFVEVETDDEGMVPDDLRRKLASFPEAKLIYVVPDFQNPSGRTWSLPRRRALLELAARHEVPVVEDNPYGELRFDGEAVPALKALDASDLVLLMGTFSKIFCPGLRVGWVAAPRLLHEKLVLVKQGADLHTSTFAQFQLARYLDLHDIDANVARVREVYRSRRDAMLAALARELPGEVSWTRPSGGLFVWVTLPVGLDARALLERCLEHDVAFVPNGSFFPNGGHENTLRLNFSNMPEPRIDEGVRRLAAALRDLVAASATLGTARPLP